MPTYDAQVRFRNEYKRLTVRQRQQFKVAMREFVGILESYESAGCHEAPKFPNSLGVKRMAGRGKIMEFAWAPDGRCTWEFGAPRRPGMYHIAWRRIGSHSIFDDP